MHTKSVSNWNGVMGGFQVRGSAGLFGAADDEPFKKFV